MLDRKFQSEFREETIEKGLLRSGMNRERGDLRVW